VLRLDALFFLPSFYPLLVLQTRLKRLACKSLASIDLADMVKLKYRKQGDC